MTRVLAVRLLVLCVFAAGLVTLARLAWGMIGARPARLVAPLGMLAGPIAAQQAVPPTTLGINLSEVTYYLQQRAFANLAMGDNWRLALPGQSWSDMPAERVGPNGELLSLPPGAAAPRKLMPPSTPPGGALIRCTWAGRAKVTVDAQLAPRPGRNSIEFRYDNKWDGFQPTLGVTEVSPADPLRDLDCREADMARAARFDPAFVRWLSGFGAIRFMDWQQVNGNRPVSWARRTTPHTTELRTGGDGVAVEDMVTLAREVGADPWFTMPWTADATYVEAFARMVHDTLPAERRIYVEVGNEIWNLQFPAAKQALEEGRARRLGADDRAALMHRYAERTVEVMRIWERVFADRPRQLVRVASTQHVLPDTAALVLGYRDTAQHVDALATAPYFGFDITREGMPASADVVMQRLAGRIGETIDMALANKAVAARYGKRYIAYEAGQHVVIPNDQAFNTAVQRDQRMYGLYRDYIAQWRRRVGDTLMIFGSISPVGPFGGWGLVEHSGQPEVEAPKLRAVREALAVR